MQGLLGSDPEIQFSVKSTEEISKGLNYLRIVWVQEGLLYNQSSLLGFFQPVFLPQWNQIWVFALNFGNLSSGSSVWPWFNVLHSAGEVVFLVSASRLDILDVPLLVLGVSLLGVEDLGVWTMRALVSAKLAQLHVGSSLIPPPRHPAA